MSTATNGIVRTVPINGQPTTLAEYVADEARSYRSQGTTEAAFIAEQLDRVEQLIAWTSATTPAEFRDRLEVWDRQIAEDHFERGRAAGYDDARFEFARHI
jgi:hypothetical protein